MADTIALMRQRVLDMAIRGELVKQREEEGTAAKLYSIIEERKKSKKNQKLLEIDGKDLPFSIPKSWKWVRLSEIGTIIGGGTPKTNIDAYWIDGDIPWVSPADLTNYKKKYISQGKKNITQIGLEKSSARLMDTGAVLFSSRAPIGYVAIAENPISTNQGFKSVVPYVMEMNEYMYYYFFAFIDNIKSRSSGTTFKEISGRELGNSLFPLPPLNEQKRIVAKIEEIFAVIDQIGTRKQESLAIIQNMRQTALQDAIKGVLVEQDEKDEPASILYKKIQAEKEQLVKEKKIKKEKPLPDIDPDEVPFEIPDSWKWVRMSDILDVRDGTHDTPKYVNEGAPLITSKNLKKGKLDLSNIKYISEKDALKINERSKVDVGDILFAMIGTIGNPVIIDTDMLFSIKNVALFKMFSKYISNMFVYYFLLMSESYLDKIASGGVQKFVSLKKFRSMVIPLPPIAEQERIIAKLDEIIAICDQMEAILDGTSEANGPLKIVE